MSLISTDQTLLAPGCILSFMCNSGIMRDWHHHSKGDNGEREMIILFILIQSSSRAEIWALQLVLVNSKGRVTKFGRKTRWRTKTRQLRLLSCKTHRYIAMTLTRTWENGRYYWKKWYIIIIRWIWGSQSFAMSVHRRKFVETMQKCSHL